MKASTSDYVSITAALVAILLCGFGVGFLVGERLTLERVETRASDGDAHSQWFAETVGRLASELNLTEAQTAAVEVEVAAAAREIEDARRAAILDYHRALLDLHLRLLPHLDPDQRRAVQESYETLKSSLDKLEAPEESSD